MLPPAQMSSTGSNPRKTARAAGTEGTEGQDGVRGKQLTDPSPWQPLPAQFHFPNGPGARISPVACGLGGTWDLTMPAAASTALI